jgi:hypothetical protein
MHEPDLLQTYPAAGIAHLCLHLISADLTIETRPRNDIRVIATGIREEPQLLPRLYRDSDTLHLEGDSESALRMLHLPTRLKLHIQVPPGLRLTIRMLSGSVQVKGTFAHLDARVRFGSVAGCVDTPHTQIRVFAGDVWLGGLTGAADVQLSLGDVTMAWASLSLNAAIEVRTFAGKTHLELPDHLVLVSGRAMLATHAPTTKCTTTSYAGSPQAF